MKIQKLRKLQPKLEKLQFKQKILSQLLVKPGSAWLTLTKLELLRLSKEYIFRHALLLLSKSMKTELKK